MIAKGRYTTVLDAISMSDLVKPNEYTDYINPLDYDFHIKRNQEYLIVGAIQRKNSIWLYIIDDDDILIVPQVLFEFTNYDCSSYVFYIDDNEKSLGVIIKELADIDYWFERYINEDNQIIDIINSKFR